MAKKNFITLFILVLVCGLASSIAFTGRVQAASSIPKPSVPEFTLKLVRHTFDIPATTSIDPFTGENKIILGNHWEWTTLDIIITNQKFYGVVNSSYLSYSGPMFNVRYKGHYAQDWTVSIPTYDGPPYIIQNSNATHTVFSVGIEPFDLSTIDTFRWNVTRPYEDLPDGAINLPSRGEVDFQVKAMLGTTSRNPTIPFSWWTFEGEESGWSNTQTIMIGTESSTTLPDANSPTTSPDTSDSTTAPATPPSSTSKPDQTTEPATNETAQALSLAIIGVGIAFVLVSVGLLVYSKKHTDHEAGR